MLASLPGALSLVMAVAEGLKTDMKRIAMSQSLRILILVEGIPLISLLMGHAHERGEAAQLPVAGLRDLLLLFAAGIAASLILGWLRVAGGWMFGGLIASAALLLTGIVEARLPGIVLILGTIALASITGSRFRPGDLRLIPRIAWPALVAFAIAAGISAFSAGMVTLLLGIDFIQTLLAFGPGALDALTILAFQMNIDPAYVAAHHVARFVALSFAAPLIARFLSRRE
jgi:membrane AbrB-like protein